MRYFIAFLLAWFFAVVNVSALPYIKILGVTPDFVLIFAACWAVLREPDEALIVIPVAGFLRDLAGSDPLGTSVIALAPIVLLAAAVRLRAVDSQFLPTVIVVMAGSAAYSVISAVILRATGQEIAWGHFILRIAFPLILVNGVFTPFVYLPISRLMPAPRPSILGPGRITSPL